MNYGRFFAMIGTSTVVMFGLMYLNTYLWPHVLFSETRAYMAVLMGAVMAIVMLSFMWAMYGSRAVNVAILAGSAVVFAGMLFLVRSQVTVGDVSYLRAMIPHHSIAIMTSTRADIADPRVRKLADEIIAAQNKEIAEMKYLIADLQGREAGAPIPPGASEDPAPLGTINDALSTVSVKGLDAQAMTEEEIDKVLTMPGGCQFLRTSDSPPILATTPSGDRGVMKLNDQLIELTLDDSGQLVASGLSMTVAPVDGGDNTAADLAFDLEAGLRVVYRGYFTCDEVE